MSLVRGLATVWKTGLELPRNPRQRAFIMDILMREFRREHLIPETYVG